MTVLIAFAPPQAVSHLSRGRLRGLFGGVGGDVVGDGEGGVDEAGGEEGEEEVGELGVGGVLVGVGVVEGLRGTT